MKIKLWEVTGWGQWCGGMAIVIDFSEEEAIQKAQNMSGPTFNIEYKNAKILEGVPVKGPARFITNFETGE